MTEPKGAVDANTGRVATATRRVSVRAPAKVNLFLHVGEKRPDKYHALESLVVFAEQSDRLEISSAFDLSLKFAGPFGAQVPRGGDNLVLKAAAALKAAYPQVSGAAIVLEKSLPVAAGIGGGSADAAAVLRALNLFWGLNRAEVELLDIAAKLGSDIPACVLSSPCWMTGRGEHVARTPSLPPLAMILVNPGVMLSTAEVFGALNARSGVGAMRPPSAGVKTLWDVVSYLDDAGNDLEAPACRLHPVIDDVLDALNEEPGCVLSQMSGSGATCFGLFDGEQFAIGASERIAQEHPHWWVRTTRIAAADVGEPQWL